VESNNKIGLLSVSIADCDRRDDFILVGDNTYIKAKFSKGQIRLIICAPKTVSLKRFHSNRSDIHGEHRYGQENGFIDTESIEKFDS